MPKTIQPKGSYPDIYRFEAQGDNITGKLEEITTGFTQYGEAQFLKITDQFGLSWSVCISANLAMYEWETQINEYISITYIGKELNKKTKRQFKKFKVEVLTEDEAKELGFSDNIITDKDVPF